MYYLVGTTISLVLDFPLATVPSFDLVLADMEMEEDCAVASCEVLRRMVVAVLGDSTGTVGARIERGCLDGHAL